MKRFFVILSAALLLASCSDASRDPVIKGYRLHQVGGLGFGLDGVTADVKLDLEIENPSSAKYTLEALDATLFPAYDTVAYAYVTLKEPAFIEARSDATIGVPLAVRITKPLSILGAGGLSGDFSDYVADIDLLVRKGALKKHIKKERMPMKDIGKLLGNTSKTEDK